MGYPIVNIMEGQWKLTKQSESPHGGKAFVKQILVSEERNISKRAGL